MEKDCLTCLNRCLDMDMDFYCAAPKILETNRFGLYLPRAKSKCLVNGEYSLWEEDIRGKE